MNADLFYRMIRDRLRASEGDLAGQAARILLEDIGGLARADITGSVDLAPDIVAAIEQAVERRCTGEPLGRILGYRDFWKDRFLISRETLEPRPDTETLIESVLRACGEKMPRTILDLGTGSGCILLSLLREFPQAQGVGVDISADACATSRRNARNLGLADRCAILEGSWLDPLEEGARFDVIVSNPPYIPQAEIRNLQDEVRNFDPLRALDGGKDGLDPYKILLPKLKKHLEPGGHIFFEYGIGQTDDLARLVTDHGFEVSRVVRDLGGVERVMEITVPGEWG